MENSVLPVGCLTTLQSMDVIVTSMPPSGAEDWWSTEPQLHSWDSAGIHGYDLPESRVVVSIHGSEEISSSVSRS